MAMRVTGRGKTGRSRLSPHSHILTKAVGDTISASWDVMNTGGVSAFGALDILFPSLGIGFSGGLTNIPAGATVTLNVSGVITTLTPGTTYNAEVRAIAAEPATVAPGAVHPFTLIVSGTPPSLYSDYLAQVTAATTENELLPILNAFRADWDADRLSYDEYSYLNHAWSFQLFTIRGEPDTSYWSILKGSTPLSVADGGMTKSDMIASGLWPS